MVPEGLSAPKAPVQEGLLARKVPNSTSSEPGKARDPGDFRRMRAPRTRLADSLRIAGGWPADRPPEFSLSPESPVARTGHRENADMNAKKITQSPNARKVVGSLGILGAAAAVAGMGTFGTFTDSTTPIAATISSGTIDIDVTGP